jgi:hypothetical protein
LQEEVEGFPSGRVGGGIADTEADGKLASGSGILAQESVLDALERVGIAGLF